MIRFTYLLIIFSYCLSQDSAVIDTVSMKQQILNFHKGFISSDAKMIRKSIGTSLLMFDGQNSVDPSDWNAHMFLTSEQIDDWISFMLNNAGPFENTTRFKSISVRQNLAIVVTFETGKNKFRRFENEETAWLLGFAKQKWKIKGFYIREVQRL